MIKITPYNFIYLLGLLFLLSCKQSGKKLIHTSNVIAGKSKITGKITSINNIEKDSVFINIIVPHPISGEYVSYKTLVDQFGKFSIDVDVETVTTLISVNTSVNPEKFLLVKLLSGVLSNIDIDYNSDNDIKNINITPTMNQNDLTQGFAVRDKMIAYRPDRAPQPLYNKSTDYYLNQAKSGLSERLDILKNDTLLSKELKNVLAKDYSLILYNTYVFDYEHEMIRNYRNTNSNKSKTPNIQKINRTYFRFLKDFDLNDPQYLHAFEFIEFQKKVLQNEVLSIPEIGDNNIAQWLTSVKIILSDLVGFNDGYYYDILVANAYSKQLNEQIKPLSEKQKHNIVNYWKNGEIAKILFRKNQQIIELDKVKSVAVINNISLVKDDKVIDTILSKYKNKVVFIDLWATWCAPCLEAMQRFRNTKSNFRDKNIVFVYITNASSPRKLWEEKIKGIGDEHYYLTDSQWEYIMNHFGFDAIPSYLLYDKEGIFINKFTTLPENERVKYMINSLL